MNIKFFGDIRNQGKLQVHEQLFKLEGGPETLIEVETKFEVKAVLLNSGTKGYARVLLDPASISFFLSNMNLIEDQLDRSYIWMILRDHLKLCMLSPKDYLQCIIGSIEQENEQNTLSYLLTQVSFIMGNWIQSQD